MIDQLEFDISRRNPSSRVFEDAVRSAERTGRVDKETAEFEAEQAQMKLAYATAWLEKVTQLAADRGIALHPTTEPA